MHPRFKKILLTLLPGKWKRSQWPSPGDLPPFSYLFILIEVNQSHDVLAYCLYRHSEGLLEKQNSLFVFLYFLFWAIDNLDIPTEIYRSVNMNFLEVVQILRLHLKAFGGKVDGLQLFVVELRQHLVAVLQSRNNFSRGVLSFVRHGASFPHFVVQHHVRRAISLAALHSLAVVYEVHHSVFHSFLVSSFVVVLTEEIFLPSLSFFL